MLMLNYKLIFHFKDHFSGLTRLAGGLKKVIKDTFGHCLSDTF